MLIIFLLITRFARTRRLRVLPLATVDRRVRGPRADARRRRKKRRVLGISLASLLIGYRLVAPMHAKNGSVGI